MASLTGHMARLCAHEDIAIPEESITLVAREAGGSMRDALSLLDQVMTCSEGPVTHEQVLNIVGVVDRHIISDLAGALLEGDIGRVLTTIKTVYDRGQDLKKLYADLLTHVRNLLVIKLGDPSAPLIDLPESEVRGLEAQVQGLSAGALNQVFTLLYRDEPLVRLAAQPQLAIEMVLMQICQIKPALPMDELIEKVEALRQAIVDGGKGETGLEEAVATPAATAPRQSDGPAIDRAQPTEAPGQNSPGALPANETERQALWDRIVDMLQTRLPALAANLQQSSLRSAADDAFEIEVKGNEFNINRVKRQDSMAAIRQAVNEILGRSPAIVIQGLSADPAARRQKKNHEEQMKQQALSHPTVSEVVELFQGKVVDVKIIAPCDEDGQA